MLDTQTLIGWALGFLPDAVRERLDGPDQLFVSVVSFWECLLKPDLSALSRDTSRCFLTCLLERNPAIGGLLRIVIGMISGHKPQWISSDSRLSTLGAIGFVLRQVYPRSLRQFTSNNLNVSISGASSLRAKQQAQ